MPNDPNIYLPDLTSSNDPDAPYGGFEHRHATGDSYSLATAYPNFDPTVITCMGDDIVAIEQAPEDSDPLLLMLSRDMVVELVGVLNVYIRDTAA